MHIEHFIGSNPLLASTSCTDPVNNLKNLPKKTHIETPQIVLNLTDNNLQITRIKSRSPSPFWIKDETSTYSEVVKTGYILSRNNSRSTSPKSKHISEHISRNSNRNLLQMSIKRDRSQSPKDKCKQNYFEPTKTLSRESLTITTEALQNTNKSNSKSVKRRSRSRRNRNEKHFETKAVSDNIVIKTATTPENVIIDQIKFKNQTIKPEIIISDIKKQNDNCENVKCIQSSLPFTETCSQTDKLLDDSHAIFDQNLLTSETTKLLNTVGHFSKSRLSLTNIFNTGYTNSCFDLNEQLKGIFGSINKKHYKHHVFDRPRSKSDTRDLNNLAQIFTNPNSNDKYTCRFERSAESVKNNSTTSIRRSFDNILSPFANTRLEQSDGNDHKHAKSVR